jgi:hypothetical protein
VGDLGGEGGRQDGVYLAVDLGAGRLGGRHHGRKERKRTRGRSGGERERKMGEETGKDRKRLGVCVYLGSTVAEDLKEPRQRDPTRASLTPRLWLGAFTPKSKLTDSVLCSLEFVENIALVSLV